MLDKLCQHRTVPLVYGRNEDCGLLCLYHGWKMDVDGNVVAMSSKPEGSPLMDKVKGEWAKLGGHAAALW